MITLLNSNFKRYYNNDLISCAGLFTLCILVLVIVLPGLIVYHSGGKFI